MTSSTATDAEKSNEHPVKKIVIRRLPPTLTKEQFLDIVSPLPDYEYFYFCNADPTLGQNAFSRAYFCFKNNQDVLNFRDRFDNYVFLDSKSNEYPALVEYAPYQRRFKLDPKNPPKKDSKCNTIHEDPDYLTFLETFGKPSEEQLPSCEAILEELEQKEKDNLGPLSAPKVTTPLLEYLKKKKDEKRSAKDRDRRRRDRDRDDDKRYGSGYGGKRRDDYYYGPSYKSKDQSSGSQKQPQTKITLASKSEFKGELSNKPGPQNTSKPNVEKQHSSVKNNAPVKEKERANRTSYGYRGSGGSKNYDDKYYKEKSSTPTKIVEPKPIKEEKKESSEKDGQKPVRNKDRPSIQIYNPGQRTNIKQQKF